MNGADDEVLGSKAPVLARLVKQTWEGSQSFSADELRSIMASRLDRPFVWSGPATGSGHVGFTSQELPRETTLRQLLGQAAPPLPLLQSAKDYAKACFLNPEGSLPPEVATVIYLLCIAVALTRNKTRISSLSDEALSEGFAWASAFEWVDPDSRRWLLEGQRLL